MNSILLNILTLATLISTASCKPLANNGSSRAGFIIGVDNILPLNAQSATKVPTNSMAAAVLIATTIENNSIKFCSGSLIEPGPGSTVSRILTNHHCFAKETNAGEVLPELRSQACEKTMIYFGFNEMTHYRATKIPCKIGSLRTDPIGDLAVFELASEPPPGIVPFTLWPDDYPPPGRKAYIIHHPDVAQNLHVPEGDKIALPAASITTDDCQTQGLFPEDQWPLDPVLRFSFKHTCDLIHGSSGSALIDRETNRILGVNWGGMKINFQRAQQIDNVSTKAGYVRSFLNNPKDNRYQIAGGESSAKVASTANVASGTVSNNSQKNSNAGSQFASIGCGSTGISQPNSPLSAKLIILLMLLVPAFIFRKLH